MAKNNSNIGVETHLSVGSVLSRSFSTLLSNPLIFLLPFIIEALHQVFWVFFPQFGFGLGFGFDITITFIVQTFLSVMSQVLSQGVIIFAVYQVLLGNRSSIGESMSYCLARLATLCNICVLITLFFVAIFVAVLIPSYLLTRFIDFSIPPEFPFVNLLNRIPTNLLIAVAPAFLIWGLIVFIQTLKWILSTSVCIVEDLNAVKSIKRSSSLTKGYRLNIMILMFVIGFFSWILGFIAGWIVPDLGTVGSAFLNSITKAFSYVMFVVFYFDLLAVKEGISIDKVEEVFN